MAKSWYGPEPAELLADRLMPGALLRGPSLRYDHTHLGSGCDVEGHDDVDDIPKEAGEEASASGHEANISLSILGGAFSAPSPSSAAGIGGAAKIAVTVADEPQLSYCSSGICTSGAAARQNAALAALHCLDVFLRHLFLHGAAPGTQIVPPTNTASSQLKENKFDHRGPNAGRFSEPAGSLEATFQIQRPGHAWIDVRWPVAGATVTFNYSIRATAGCLESGRKCYIELGTGALVPVMEAGIGMLGVGGVACAVVHSTTNAIPGSLAALAYEVAHMVHMRRVLWLAVTYGGAALSASKPPATLKRRLQLQWQPTVSSLSLLA